MRALLLVPIATAIAVAAWATSPGETVVVRLPPLSLAAEVGKKAFQQHCAECHGPNGGGSGKGPPLVHKIYQPGHHADFAFQRAIELGVRAHHWRFGDMPRQPQISKNDTAAIIRFVREVQRANGIE